MNYNFRPRLGMGWFDGNAKGELESMRFSSPSGDGLVRSITQTVSVTALYFRPRLGMGWFKNTEHHTVTANIFVPTWGWVVSLHTKDFIKLDMFSSPSGDGLVPL